MGEISRALAQGTEFTFDNRTYVLSPWTYEIQGKFERYIEGQAIDAARRLGARCTPEERKEMMAQVSRDVVAGLYTFGSSLVLESLQVPQHVQYLFFLGLKKNHPELTQEFAKKVFEADPALVYQKINEAAADPTTKPEPKEEAPAAPGSASPSP